MIVTQIIGGLGNQMFMYAAGRRLANKLGTEFKMDITGYRYYDLHKYGLKIFNIKERYYDQGVEASNLKIPQEVGFSFQPNILNLSDNTYLKGYWQSDKYFKDIADIIKKEFIVVSPISQKNSYIYTHIRDENSVSLHVRRTDYITSPPTHAVHGTCGPNYYRDAVEYFKTKIGKDIHFYVFSDDIAWCESSLKLKNSTFVNWGNPNYEDFRLMVSCKYHIIANSTFSWWAAWLNRDKDKIVVAPKEWFRDKSRDTKDLYPEGWVRL